MTKKPYPHSKYAGDSAKRRLTKTQETPSRSPREERPNSACGDPAAPVAPTKAGTNRGRPKAGPRVRKNKRRRGTYDLLDLYDKPYHTDATTEAQAKRILADKLKELRDRGDERIPAPSHILIGDVIAKSGHVARKGSLQHLKAFWKRIPLTRLSRDLCWLYGETRLELETPPLISTVNNELSQLRNIVNTYCDAHGYIRPTVYMLAQEVGVRAFLRVREVERLLASADFGWTWDADREDWVRGADEQPVCRDAQWLSYVAPMRRFIRLAVWTGTRTDAIRRAGWSNSDKKNRPWFDLRIGVFRRRGANERETRKRRPPVPLMKTLEKLTVAWAVADAKKGCDDVIHRDGKPLSFEAVYDAFHEVRRAAGIGDHVSLRVLRATCAVYLMEGGCTPEEAAAFLGNTAGVISRFYDRYATEFSHAAADALDSRSYAPNKGFKRWVKARQKQHVVRADDTHSRVKRGVRARER